VKQSLCRATHSHTHKDSGGGVLQLRCRSQPPKHMDRARSEGSVCPLFWWSAFFMVPWPFTSAITAYV
jgi:hypothetical protein